MLKCEGGNQAKQSLFDDVLPFLLWIGMLGYDGYVYMKHEGFVLNKLSRPCWGVYYWA